MSCLEKADECPHCGKTLSQAEYDLQSCDTCDTGFDFQPKERIIMVDTPPILPLPPIEQIRMHIARDKPVCITCPKPLTSKDIDKLILFLQVQSQVLKDNGEAE